METLFRLNYCMDYNGFKNMVCEHLKKYDPKVKEIFIGGRFREVLYLKNKEVWIQDIYERFCDEKDKVFSFVVSAIVDEVKYNTKEACLSIGSPFLLDQLMWYVVNGDANWLEYFPHRSYLNLSVVYCFFLEDTDLRMTAMKCSMKQMFLLGLTEQELYEIARKNTERLFPMEMLCLNEDMTILTNRKKMLGAGEILYPEVFEVLAQKCDDDLVVIPSSINELLVLPKHKLKKTASKINKIVWEMNRETLRPEERLSDVAYVYSKDTRQMKMLG